MIIKFLLCYFLSSIFLPVFGQRMNPQLQKALNQAGITLDEAKKIGFPVLLKASAGGGGKGMRTVFKESDFLGSLDEVKSEAKNIFGDDRIIIEKYIVSGRHVEIQILGDDEGNIFHFFDKSD